MGSNKSKLKKQNQKIASTSQNSDILKKFVQSIQPSNSQEPCLKKNIFTNIFKDFLFFCAFFLVLGAIFSLFFLNSAPPASWEYGFEATTLAKTSSFNLSVPMVFKYEIISNNDSRTMELRTKYLRNCSGLVIEDKLNDYSLCILKSGMHSNFSTAMGDSSFIFYSPWMLSLNDSFSWSVNRTFTSYPVNITYRSPLFFNVVNKTKIFGRDAFEIKLYELADDSTYFTGATLANFTYYVDTEYRILLKAQSNDVQIILTNASFTLN